MEKDNLKTNASENINNWFITIAIIFISLSGITLSLICIYALPNRTIKPFEGSLYFASAAIIIVGLLVYQMLREKRLFFQNNCLTESKPPEIVIHENISDKLIKWLVTIFSFFFTFSSISIALICIYALPDRTVQPLAGIAYMLSGALVLCVFIFVVWKNWSTKVPQQKN